MYKVDEYIEPSQHRGVILLSAELPEAEPLADELIAMLAIEREVTGDARFKSVYMSLR